MADLGNHCPAFSASRAASCSLPRVWPATRPPRAACSFRRAWPAPRRQRSALLVRQYDRGRRCPGPRGTGPAGCRRSRPSRCIVGVRQRRTSHFQVARLSAARCRPRPGRQRGSCGRRAPCPRPRRRYRGRTSCFPGRPRRVRVALHGNTRHGQQPDGQHALLSRFHDWASLADSMAFDLTRYSYLICRAGTRRNGDGASRRLPCTSADDQHDQREAERTPYVGAVFAHHASVSIIL